MECDYDPSYPGNHEQRRQVSATESTCLVLSGWHGHDFDNRASFGGLRWLLRLSCTFVPGDDGTERSTGAIAIIAFLEVLEVSYGHSLAIPSAFVA